ncbi:hypothetical protein DFQ27_001555 [Actinomortierella ambigua]|uniref:DUF6589 domain-containing protein n=1 Tax=Actinomortierella ambigua TaxID=1343610 RepID=A0A9P6PHN3_9FUNG|nr:hypothetical protein DFQ27_001555 [Actinomortierella ambigua]
MIDGFAIDFPAVDCLPVVKTEAYPMPILPHGQSTPEGVCASLEEMVDHAGLDRDTLAKGSMIVGGDLFTVDRLRQIKRLVADDPSPYGSYRWVFPVFQLFHLQITLANTILRTHWGDAHAYGSLANLVKVLDHKRVNNTDKSDVSAADQFLRSTFDATVEGGSRRDDG